MNENSIDMIKKRNDKNFTKTKQKFNKHSKQKK